jgi:hypothetical protein
MFHVLHMFRQGILDPANITRKEKTPKFKVTDTEFIKKMKQIHLQAKSLKRGHRMWQFTTSSI